MNKTDLPSPALARSLNIRCKPDETRQDAVARSAIQSENNAAATAEIMAGRLFGQENVDVPGCASAIAAIATQVVAGNLETLEQMRAAHAVTHTLLFQDQARRALAAKHDKARELELKLALKAQAQCRATVEALAEIKNPAPKVFARQANIAHGPQQVNNHAPARGKKSGRQSNELLETQNEQSEWLDAGAAGEAGRTDPAMAAVGKIHRPDN